MAILDLTYFQKANALNIPLSVSAPIANVAMQTPNMEETLTLLIDEVEKNVMLNALGLNLYNLFLAALVDIDNPINIRFKKLVQGEEYSGKKWEGLQSDHNLLAWRVYQMYQTKENTILSGVGNVKANPEKAFNVNPIQKIVEASQNFIYKYQFDNCYNYNDVEVSLYRYLLDKKDDFPEWVSFNFRFYKQINSLGL